MQIVEILGDIAHGQQETEGGVQHHRCEKLTLCHCEEVHCEITDLDALNLPTEQSHWETKYGVHKLTFGNCTVLLQNTTLQL